MGTAHKNSSDVYEQGGAGGLSNAQNLGLGTGVFSGLSSGNTVLDLYSIGGINGISTYITSNTLVVDGSGIVGENIIVAESFPFGTGNSPNKTLVNETFYGAISPLGSGKANTVYMWCEVLGTTKTDVLATVYNDAGTRLGWTTVAVAPSAVGLFSITLTNFSSGSQVDLVESERYWIGLGGSNGSNSQWSGDNSATNSTSYNRFVTADPSPNVSLPAGVATAGRFWFRLGYV